MKLLVTGGAGYIGSVATEMLIQRGHQVLVFDNLQQGHVAAIEPGARFVHGDLRDAAAIDGAIRDFRPEAVMHFAANSLVGVSMREPFEYLGDNVVAGLNLFRAMDTHGVRKIILSSTANLFADPLKMPIAEDERIIPGSPYGESKGILERMLYWLSITRGFRYAFLRYFNAAGATATHGEDHDPELHLIPLVLQVAQGKREKISVFGDNYPTPDGTCIRDYIHVEDLIEAHILALGALEQGNRTYNLGNGRGFSVKEVVAAAERVTGKKISVEIALPRAGDPAILVASSKKIRAELGWTPKHPDIESIVRTAWDWHQRHPEGYPE
jgi:UDP-glucose 4-epimerase